MRLGAVLLVAVVAAASWAGTELVRRYATARAILDVPNERSSHRVPTPRGGGLAIAASVLAGLAAGAGLGWIPAPLALACVGGGAAVAGIGWLDDRRHVSARLRLAVQVGAAIWALAWIGVPDALAFGRTTMHPGVAGPTLAVLGVVWLTNLFNFMDGIDGIAGGEAVVVGAISGVLLLDAGRPGLGLAAMIVAAGALGFLYWNWAPARIFMGDAGSGFLGFVFAVLALASERAGAVPLWGWVLLLGAFIFDATLTLVRRVAAGEAWYSAHRRHAYQRAVAAGRSHAAVTGAALAVTAGLGLLVYAGVRSGAPAAFMAAGGAILVAVYLLVERWEPMRNPSGNRRST